jgi:hypothetical protein
MPSLSWASTLEGSTRFEPLEGVTPAVVGGTTVPARRATRARISDQHPSQSYELASGGDDCGVAGLADPVDRVEDRRLHLISYPEIELSLV